ncbi:methyltransferase [Nocardia sp. AG03]|uniref:methyltransferase n=1 Tax=Nocardia sp. AG03 TaxID=3025312 RepID=UPI00241844B1|nr:methyltransferase [Nocardia sp. AG03]
MTDRSAAPSLAAQLTAHALSTACAAALRAAVTLGLPEAVGDRAATPAELAVTLDVDATALHRLLRLLTSHGVFAEDDAGGYRHTPESLLLRRDSPDCLADLVLWCTEPWTWSLWGHLDTAVRTGTEIFTGVHGRRFYEHLPEAWPDSAQVFDRAMTQQSRSAARAVAETLASETITAIADVGAGQGTVLAALLERCPAATGYLLDLPHVVADAGERFHPGGDLAERVRLTPCDCLREVPARAELYLLKNILGMDDDNAVRIVRNVVRAAPPGARVVIVENLIDDGPTRPLATALDLRMLLVIGGRKHTLPGLLSIVERGGLIVSEVRPVDADLHMIDASVPG